MYPIDYDKPQFLEPAHSHDPFAVSHIITLPTSLTKNIPMPFQEALTALHESTSVAFASFKRLQALAGDRFHRLVPVIAELSSSPVDETGLIKCIVSSLAIYVDDADIYKPDSEPAFFTYRNQLQAEKRYLLEEVLPDWRHKATRLMYEDRQFETEAAFQGKKEVQADFETWWAALQEEVNKWFEEAQDMEKPVFEDTVADFRIFQDKDIRRLARQGRHRRKSILELDLPELTTLERAETVDSGIGMSYTSETDECEFAA